MQPPLNVFTNFLDAIIGQCAVPELFATENETLLIARNALPVLDLRLHIVDRVSRHDVERDRSVAPHEADRLISLFLRLEAAWRIGGLLSSGGHTQLTSASENDENVSTETRMDFSQSFDGAYSPWLISVIIADDLMSR